MTPLLIAYLVIGLILAAAFLFLLGQCQPFRGLSSALRVVSWTYGLTIFALLIGGAIALSLA